MAVPDLTALGFTQRFRPLSIGSFKLLMTPITNEKKLKIKFKLYETILLDTCDKAQSIKFFSSDILNNKVAELVVSN